MSEKQAHQLLILFLVCDGLLTAFLLMMEPVVGWLFGLLSVFGVVIWMRVKPGLWQAEKRLWSARLSGVKKSAFSAPEQQMRTQVSYELIMVRPDTGRVFPVQGKEMLIGRGARCSCLLTESPAVGREHCRIIHREHSQEYYIEDLRSQNGTYLGTRRLEPNTQVKLLENTEIIIGDITLRFVRR